MIAADTDSPPARPLGSRALAPLWLSACVNRWHQNAALAHTGQSNADHQGRCVLLLLALNPCASLALIRAMATHDVGEYIAGDLSRDFKRAAPVVAARHAEVEATARQALFAADWPLTEGETLWLKLVDQLEAHCWCLHRAPQEYHRRRAGWLADEADLFARAEALGVGPQVRGMIHDMKSGDW